MRQVRHIGMGIAAPYAAAYPFTAQPANFALWAAGLASTLHETPEGWIAATPEGEAWVTFSEPNAFGILDHRVRVAGKPEIAIPLRMIALEDGVEVVLSLIRQPDMDDAGFERDATLVMKDLHALKALLEERFGTAAR